jgi:hypothetical protein
MRMLRKELCVHECEGGGGGGGGGGDAPHSHHFTDTFF